MDLGAFSISLAVKDLQISLAFYKKLGFEPTQGGENWQILHNGERVIGLFQGMFEQNIMTFNPGWNQHGKPTESFTDIRQIEKQLRADGLEPSGSNTAEKEAGPAHFMLQDPDGNTILVDQHR